MPEKEIRKRGGAIRWRTIKPDSEHYIHIAVVRKAGKRKPKPAPATDWQVNLNG